MTSAIAAPELALSSLIFTLADDATAQEEGMAGLQSFPGLSLGQRQGNWVPGVLESESPTEAFRALEQLPGIELVEVVYVEIPAPGADSTATAPSRHA